MNSAKITSSCQLPLQTGQNFVNPGILMLQYKLLYLPQFGFHYPRGTKYLTVLGIVIN